MGNPSALTANEKKCSELEKLTTTFKENAAHFIPSPRADQNRQLSVLPGRPSLHPPITHGLHVRARCHRPLRLHMIMCDRAVQAGGRGKALVRQGVT